MIMILYLESLLWRAQLPRRVLSYDLAVDRAGPGEERTTLTIPHSQVTHTSSALRALSELTDKILRLLYILDIRVKTDTENVFLNIWVSFHTILIFDISFDPDPRSSSIQIAFFL